jgi:hypothetical protein
MISNADIPQELERRLRKIANEEIDRRLGRAPQSQEDVRLAVERLRALRSRMTLPSELVDEIVNAHRHETGRAHFYPPADDGD